MLGRVMFLLNVERATDPGGLWRVSSRRVPERLWRGVSRGGRPGLVDVLGRGPAALALGAFGGVGDLVETRDEER